MTVLDAVAPAPAQASFDAADTKRKPQGYSSVVIEAMLDRLRDLCPRIALVRTDHMRRTSRHPERTEGTIELLPKKIQFEISTHPPIAEKSIREIQRFLGISPQQATDVLDVFVRLAAINPHGHWVVDPSLQRRSDRAAEAVSHPLIKDVVDDLRDKLPYCRLIRADTVVQGMPGGNVRQRTLLRFFGHDDDVELAAMDTAHCSAHIEALITRVNPHSIRNAIRAAIWAKQIGAYPSNMASIMHDLQLLFAHLPLSSLDLRLGKSHRKRR